MCQDTDAQNLYTFGLGNTTIKLFKSQNCGLHVLTQHETCPNASRKRPKSILKHCHSFGVKYLISLKTVMSFQFLTTTN